jgi:hypothetical protein
MSKKVTNLRWVILFIFLLISWANEDFAKLIAKDWHPRVVEENQISLLRGGADYPCYLKAYGWKILSKRREKMGIFGDSYIKWGWKAVVHNPGKGAISFSIMIQLKSEEGFVLDVAYFGEGFRERPYQKIEWVHAGETELFQGVSEFNSSEHKGEGEPNRLDISVICK